MRKTANRNRRNSLDSFGGEGGIRWLINKNACEVSTVHKDYGGKLISHARPTMGRETRLNYWGSSPIGDDRMVNMSRSSPPANCFPPIQSSSLSRPRVSVTPCEIFCEWLENEKIPILSKENLSIDATAQCISMKKWKDIDYLNLIKYKCFLCAVSNACILFEKPIFEPRENFDFNQTLHVERENREN